LLASVVDVVVSRNVTEPAVTATPPEVTVAVNVSDVPKVIAPAEAETIVVVESSVTVAEFDPVPVTGGALVEAVIVTENVYTPLAA
jgi:hypothetical protein